MLAAALVRLGKKGNTYYFQTSFDPDGQIWQFLHHSEPKRIDYE